MKHILIITLIAIVTLANVQAEVLKTKTNVEICKTYIKEAQRFQTTMSSSKVSEATFSFYKDKVVSYCGNIASKMPFEKNYFANVLMKKNKTTVNNCKMAIKMAHEYDESTGKSSFIANAHKINISDNCGTLASKQTSSFCLFDVVDNAREKLRSKCITSIEKAHTATSVKTLNTYKDEVVTNCGRLQNII